MPEIHFAVSIGSIAAQYCQELNHMHRITTDPPDQDYYTGITL